MNSADPFRVEDFEKCTDFHGHICPGLAIGYRASKAGMNWLKEHRSEDEEIVAVVETNACGADAVQVLTGCTFGKGNFFFKDYGKQVLTLISRNSGDGIRVALKEGALELTEEHRKLMEKIRTGQATEAEKQRFQVIHHDRARDILTKPLEGLFDLKPVNEPLPSKAVIEPSRPCEVCGEPTMGSKLTNIDGKLLCGGCLQK